MSISALNSGLSGLKAYSTALDSSAHNVANANTAGFTPQQVTFHEQANGGVIATISKEGASQANPELSGTDLATEIVQSIEYKTGFQLAAKIVKTQDEILGSLIDTKA